VSFCDNLTATQAKDWFRAEIARLWPVRRMIGRVRITELCDTVRFYSDLPTKRRGTFGVKTPPGDCPMLKPCVAHGSCVGAGRPSPDKGGWVSISESLCEEVWALRRDRDEFFAAHPAIV
jgi:hypothetical protein